MLKKRRRRSIIVESPIEDNDQSGDERFSRKLESSNSDVVSPIGSPPRNSIEIHSPTPSTPLPPYSESKHQKSPTNQKQFSMPLSHIESDLSDDEGNESIDSPDDETRGVPPMSPPLHTHFNQNKPSEVNKDTMWLGTEDGW